MKGWYYVLILLLLTTAGFGQELKTKNVIIITLDGYRWQELFEGADPEILANPKYTDNPEVVKAFGASVPYESREKVMPFFWNIIDTQGQLYGNRNFKNKVNCANHHLLSYPGYSEMLVGYPAHNVSSNKKKNNPNATVLEFIHKNRAFHRKVAAFATWDVFPYILRKEQSELYVNAGTSVATGNISEAETRLNELQKQRAKRDDEQTFQYALEYLKRERPRVMFIGFDETDQHSHAGRYDDYLQAAHDADVRISKLWDWIQSQPDYKDQTTIFITTDHGRGSGKNTWKNHRLLAHGSRQIWFAVLGPDTPAFGEMKMKGKYYQKQVAKTIAAFLGLQYETKQPAGEVVQTMMAIPLAAKQDKNFADHSSSE